MVGNDAKIGKFTLFLLFNKITTLLEAKIFEDFWIIQVYQKKYYVCIVIAINVYNPNSMPIINK